MPRRIVQNRIAREKLMEISETARLALGPEEAWRKIGDFGAVGDWHPMLAKVASEGNERGNVRRATGKDGSAQVERLDSYDHIRHRYSYSLVETALPVRDYTATFRIEPAGDGQAIVTWSATFEPAGVDDATAARSVGPFLKAGTDALAKTFG
jgi:hypothetical protein